MDTATRLREKTVSPAQPTVTQHTVACAMIRIVILARPVLRVRRIVVHVVGVFFLAANLSAHLFFQSLPALILVCMECATRMSVSAVATGLVLFAT
jgi:hypothetical protein